MSLASGGTYWYITICQYQVPFRVRTFINHYETKDLVRDFIYISVIHYICLFEDLTVNTFPLIVYVTYGRYWYITICQYQVPFRVRTFINHHETKDPVRDFIYISIIHYICLFEDLTVNTFLLIVYVTYGTYWYITICQYQVHFRVRTFINHYVTKDPVRDFIYISIIHYICLFEDLTVNTFPLIVYVTYCFNVEQWI